MNELAEDEKSLIGFALACYIEDLDKRIKKEKLSSNSLAVLQRNKIEKITYTKIIPDLWCGQKPDYWKD